MNVKDANEMAEMAAEIEGCADDLAYEARRVSTFANDIAGDASEPVDTAAVARGVRELVNATEAVRDAFDMLDDLAGALDSLT